MRQLRDVSVVVLVGLLLWQLVVWITGVPRYILPGPLAVGTALVENYELIAEHAGVTIIEVVVGMLLGTLLGAMTALHLTASPTAQRFLLPFMVFSQAVPVFALAPLLTLWFGYGLPSKIVMAMLIIYFPVAATFYDGLRRTPPALLDLATTMGASPAATLFKIRLPAAIPSLASGLRLASVYAPIGAVIGEWVGASRGLGYLMLLANGRVKTALMFAALLVLAVFTVFLYAAVSWLARRATQWAGVDESQ
jgi:putative hydroxymethylpyrimidine transport system permease protein